MTIPVTLTWRGNGLWANGRSFGYVGPKFADERSDKVIGFFAYRFGRNPLVADDLPNLELARSALMEAAEKALRDVC